MDVLAKHQSVLPVVCPAFVSVPFQVVFDTRNLQFQAVDLTFQLSILQERRVDLPVTGMSKCSPADVIQVIELDDVIVKIRVPHS